MSYPQKPLSDYERAFEAGRNIEAPALPMPPSMKPPTIDGGAPKIEGKDGGVTPIDRTVTGLPKTTVGFREPVAPAGPAKPLLPTPTPGPGPYWQRVNQPAAPTRHTLYPKSPWPREEIEKTWGAYIKTLGDSLWDRYQKLQPEQKALPAWQQVGANPQEAAYSIVARFLTNQSGYKSVLTPEASRGVSGRDIYRWMKIVGG